MQSLRERNKAQSRMIIRQAASDLFLRSGFDAVTIASIAEAAGVSKVTVTNYYPAKEDIVVGAIDELLPDFAATAAGVGTERRLVRAVEKLVLAEFSRRAEWTGLHDGAADYAAMVRDSAVLSRAVRTLWQRREQAFGDAMRQSLDLPEADTAVLAAQLMATVRALVDVNEQEVRAVGSVAEGDESDRVAARVRRAFHRLA